jgi:ATP-dependent helicase/nuclease subunit B
MGKFVQIVRSERILSNTFLERLYEVIRQHPLHRKVLIAESFAQAHQWLERISRKFGPVMNTEVQTLESLAVSRAEWQLTEKKIRLLSGQESFWMIQAIMNELAGLPDSYVAPPMLTPGVVHCFHRAVNDLRHAGITSRDLHPSRFENICKGDYVVRLLQDYEERLAAGNLIDSAGLIDYIEASSVPTLYMMQQHLRPTIVQQRMLKKLADDRLIVLEADAAFTAADSAFPTDRSAFFHAAGPYAEVREVFRRIAEKRMPWDQVELIASDYNVYATAIHTFAADQGIACTFSGGLPIEYSTQGRAAKLYIEWIESNYNLDVLLTGLKHGLIHIEQVSSHAAIRLLENSGIGWGRERYENWVKVALKVGEEEQDDTWKQVVVLVRKLIGELPDPGMESPASLLKGLLAFLEFYTVGHNEQERLIITHMKQAYESLGTMDPMDWALAVRYVSDIMSGLTYQTDGMPLEACIHVTSLHDGGISGRPYTFILGMNEQAWTASTAQDPVLLDEEREVISPNLLTSGLRSRQQSEERASRLAMIEGDCTLSFSSFDLTNNREIHPAYDMLQVYRNQTGNAAADFNDLLGHMGDIKGFVTQGSLIDTNDAWMSRLVSKDYRIRKGISLLVTHYSYLANGDAAAKSRADLPVSPYDGVLQDIQEPVIDAMSHLSVSRLELFGRCPLQFFYSQVLGIRVKETVKFDRSRWLDALQRGSLLHEIYCAYYTELQQRHTDGSVLQHDRALLDRLTEHILQTYIDSVSAPSPHILQKEYDTIRGDVAIFYRIEQESTSVIPKYLELPIHTGDDAFMVELAEDVKLPIKGYVDRVDEIAPHQYKIYDYKTGKNRSYREQDYFSKGTQLQHALYAVAVEQRLRQTGEDPQAEVVESAYLFPTERGMGNEVARLQNRRDNLTDLVRHMLIAMNGGVFPPTHEPMYCTFCDYKEVCGNHAILMKDKRDLPSNQQVLASVTEVNRCG